MAAVIMDSEEYGQMIIDRISELPEDMKLKIMSMLPVEDGVRMSTLSKTWKSLPISYFNFNFTKPADVWSMDKALTILQEQEPRLIGRFSFSLSGKITIDHTHHIDGWMKLVLAKHRVKVLILKFALDIRYRFPPCALDDVGASTLVVLELRGCVLDKTLIQNKDTKFSCLKELVCRKVDLNGLLGEVLSRCPSLETLRLDHHCTNFQRSQLGELSKVDIQLVSDPDEQPNRVDEQPNRVDVVLPPADTMIFGLFIIFGALSWSNFIVGTLS